MEFTGERYVPQIGGEIRYEHLHRYALSLDFVDGKTVLDIASGEGYGSALLATRAASVFGVDIDNESVTHAKNQYQHLQNLSFRVGSCDAIPLEDNLIDVVISFETIEHHDKHEEMMQEILRVLREDGILIISSPNRLVYSDQANYKNPFHVKELYYDEFYKLLAHRFKHIQIYGQRLAVASITFPITDEKYTDLTAYTEDGIKIAKKKISLNDPVYFLAICSNKDVGLNKGVESIYIDPANDLLRTFRPFHWRAPN